MQPNYLSLVKVFGAERHTVPLFQRPYVWNKADNWEPLWQDIADLADRVVASPEKPVRGHFLGTVVLEQVPHKLGGVSTREIIDGQQRLTTLQILLHAVRHALRAVEESAKEGGDDEAFRAARLAGMQLEGMTRNSAYAEEEEKYKVWPTNEDRAAFRKVMDAERPADLDGESTRFAEGYRYFFNEAAGWLKKGSTVPRSTALGAALKDQVRLIVLDLDESDEPQAIFETLNAHGTPLLPADLVKNWLLWEASRLKLDLTALYSTFWLPFDREHEFWRKEVGTGHAARARIDTFLQNWLTMLTREVVPAKHLYDRFTKRMDAARTSEGGPLDVTKVMTDVHADSKRFRSLVEPTGETRLDAFARRLATMDLVVFHPFLMALLGRTASDQADRDKVASMLESYLVRRMICDRETRGYGALTISLLAALPDGGPAAPAVHSALSEKAGTAVQWPSDPEFEERWLNRRFYSSLKRERVVMLLQAIEELYQRESSKAEPVVQFDYSRLQLEHVLPQKWREHWPVPDEEAARVRDEAVDRIGNLTLVSGKLNPSLSNSPWLNADDPPRGKRAALAQHSLLRLNLHLTQKNPDAWNEATIDARAQSLFEAARSIWAAPQAFG